MSTELYNAYHEKITLTKEQEACLKYTGEKTLMVKGIAGAGKSLVIQALAKQLLAGYSKDKHNKVAIFTFSNTLNSATKEFLSVNGEHGDYITITTLYSYISQVYKEIKGPKLKIYTDPLYSKLRMESMQEALDQHKKKYGVHRFHNLELQFWLDEVDWMKDMNVSVQDLDYYLTIPRKGRGGKVRMSTLDRTIAFQIFKQYDAIMKEKKLGEWVDYALYLIRHQKEIPEHLKFDHVLIDEAQDLSLAQMTAAMMLFKKDMIIAMDMNQRIYDKQWSTKILGPTVTKKLTKSMRTTKQIDNLAESVRKHNDEILGEDDKSLHAIPEQEGPLPKLVHIEDSAIEKKFVTDQIKAWLKQNSKAPIAIIVAKKSQIKTYSAWMTDAGIECEIIEKGSTFSVVKPGVKIVNVYNAKGLEFARVIIPQFAEGYFPYRYNPEDEEEKQLFMAKCRNLVYVAMTRAKFNLVISYAGDKGSRFIGEMDPKLYEAVGLPITYYTGGDKPVKVGGSDVQLPPIVKNESVSSEGKTLKKFFEDKGLEVIDKRAAGGALWVVGDKEKLTPIVKEAGKLFGAYGNFSSGGRAVKNRPSWFTKCKK